LYTDEEEGLYYLVTLLITEWPVFESEYVVLLLTYVFVTATQLFRWSDELKVIRCEEHNGCYISSEHIENQTEWDFALLKEADKVLGNQKE
jgi:hypothetical protein